MKIQIHRIDNSLPLPAYHTSGAAAFDFYARTAMTIAPQQIALVPSNLVMAIPEGYALIVAPRSSTPRKKGYTFPHSIGVIDSDYRGPNDEIMIQVHNPLDQPIEITVGERIAQGLIIPVVRAVWEETTEFFTADRGGFGSTGGYGPTPTETAQKTETSESSAATA